MQRAGWSRAWRSMTAGSRRRNREIIAADVQVEELGARVLPSASSFASAHETTVGGATVVRSAERPAAVGSLPNFGGLWEILSGVTKAGGTITQSGKNVQIAFDLGDVGQVTGAGRIKSNGELVGKVRLNALGVISVKAKLTVSLTDENHFQGTVTAALPLLGKKTYHFGGTKQA